MTAGSCASSRWTSHSTRRPSGASDMRDRSPRIAPSPVIARRFAPTRCPHASERVSTVGGMTMCNQCDRTTPATPDLSSHGQGPAGGTSRRNFLKSSAALATGGAAAQMLSSNAFAQGAGITDAELARVQGERRILLKGGVVLTLDRQIGDYAQAD